MPMRALFSGHSLVLQSFAEQARQGEACWWLQVSEWREGRILSLDTAQQSVVVEPWGQNRDPHSNGQVRLQKEFGQCLTCVSKDHART